MSVALTEQYIHGETLLDLGYSVLVASQSAPGSWYECREGRCTCAGFEHRGHCRHIEAVRAMVRETSDDRAAEVADARMVAPASLVVQKEEW